MAMIKSGGGSGGQEVRDQVMEFLNDGPPDEPVVDEPVVDEPVVDEPVVDKPVVDKPVVETPKRTSIPGIPDDVLNAAAPDAPVEEVDDGIEAPEEVSSNPKANHAWQALKAEKKQLAAELKALKAQQVEAPPPADKDELAKLRAELADREEKLGQYDLSSTSEFKSRFDAPVQQGLRKGHSLLVRAGRSAEEAQAIMSKLSDPSLSLEQIQDLVADEPMAVQGALMNIATDIGEIAGQRQEALKSWKDTRAALQIQEQRNREVRLTEDIEAGTKTALDQVIKEGNWMMAPSADANWNAQVQQRLAAVKGIVKTGNPETIIKWILEGVTAKPMREMLVNLHQVAEQRKAELEGLVNKSPRIRSSDGTFVSPKKSDTPRTPQQVMDELGL